MALAILIASSASAEKYFVLDISYIAGSVAFNSIDLREIDRAIKYTDNSGFLVKEVSFESKDIEGIYYNMSENKNYLVYMPYNKNASRIELYNPKNSKVMDIDVGSFADTCGDNICEGQESYESCTKDCRSGSKDDFCDGIADGICDPDCPANMDADCRQKENSGNQTPLLMQPEKEKIQSVGLQEKKQNPNYLAWILVFSGIAVISLLLFFLIKKRKEKKTDDSLKNYIRESIGKGFALQQIKGALFRAGYNEREIDRALKSI